MWEIETDFVSFSLTGGRKLKHNLQIINSGGEEQHFSRGISNQNLISTLNETEKNTIASVKGNFHNV